MSFFGLSISTLILRFYLVMIIVIAAFALHQLWIAFLALPVFISAMMGYKFSGKRNGK